MPKDDHSTRYAVFRYIETYFARNGRAPTYREITANVPLSSVDNAHYHVDNLVQEGYLKRIPNQPRNIRLTAKRMLHETPGEYVREKYN